MFGWREQYEQRPWSRKDLGVLEKQKGGQWYKLKFLTIIFFLWKKVQEKFTIVHILAWSV